MKSKAFQSAKADYDQIVRELNQSVEKGNQLNQYGSGRIFNTRVAVAAVAKAKVLIRDYDIEREALDEAIDNVWHDLMRYKKFNQAKMFAEKLGI